MLKQSPRWIASCQSALWDTFVWAPSSSSSSPLLLPLLLPPLGSVQMAEASRPDLAGVLAEQHLSPALERAYRSRDLATPGRAAARPGLAALTSQPPETDVQLAHAVQMAAQFNIDRKSMM